MNEYELNNKIKEVVKKGNWIICIDDEKKLDEANFVWEPVGEWTEILNYKPDTERDNGIFGQDKNFGGKHTPGRKLLFCEIDPKSDYLSFGDEVKVKKARILLVNELPEGLIVGGDLDLSNTDLESLPSKLIVGGSLDIRGTKIKEFSYLLIVVGDMIIGQKEPENLFVNVDNFNLNLSIAELKLLLKNLKIKPKKLSDVGFKKNPNLTIIRGDLISVSTGVKFTDEGMLVSYIVNSVDKEDLK